MYPRLYTARGSRRPTGRGSRRQVNNRNTRPTGRPRPQPSRGEPPLPVSPRCSPSPRHRPRPGGSHTLRGAGAAAPHALVEHPADPADAWTPTHTPRSNRRKSEPRRPVTAAHPPNPPSTGRTGQPSMLTLTPTSTSTRGAAGRSITGIPARPAALDLSPPRGSRPFRSALDAHPHPDIDLDQGEGPPSGEREPPHRTPWSNTPPIPPTRGPPTHTPRSNRRKSEPRRPVTAAHPPNPPSTGRTGQPSMLTLTTTSTSTRGAARRSITGIPARPAALDLSPPRGAAPSGQPSMLTLTPTSTSTRGSHTLRGAGAAAPHALVEHPRRSRRRVDTDSHPPLKPPEIGTSKACYSRPPPESALNRSNRPTLNAHPHPGHRPRPGEPPAGQ